MTTELTRRYFMVCKLIVASVADDRLVKQTVQTGSGPNCHFEPEPLTWAAATKIAFYVVWIWNIHPNSILCIGSYKSTRTTTTVNSWCVSGCCCCEWCDWLTGRLAYLVGKWRIGHSQLITSTHLRSKVNLITLYTNNYWLICPVKITQLVSHSIKKFVLISDFSYQKNTMIKNYYKSLY